MRKAAGLKKLIYVPVLNTEHELSEEIPDDKSQSLTGMWTGIGNAIEKRIKDFRSVRVYQDALPVCGAESEQVRSLAERGSNNHQLIVKLLNKGASIEGTEDQALLGREYDLLRELSERSVSSEERGKAIIRHRIKSSELLKKRDHFIASRINNTLRPGELPLLFMSLRHRLDRILERNFNIIYIIYHLPFARVKDSYSTVAQ